MMGKGHATTGAAMWAIGAVAVATTPLGDHPVLAGTGLLALVTLGSFPVHGASLIPDIDHTNGTIAHSMGWPTKMLTKIVSTLAGGHRQATHRIWFWAAVTAAMFGVYFASINAPATLSADPALKQVGIWILEHSSLLIFFIFTMFGQRALGAKWVKKLISKKLRHNAGKATRITFMIEALLLTYVASRVWTNPEDWIWLPVAISVGHFSHLIADSLTTAGIYPFRDRGMRWRLPIIGDAGSARETYWSIGCAAAYTICIATSVLSIL